MSMTFFSGIQEPMDETSEQINLQLRRATEHEKRPGYRKQPRFKNIIHLWEFLLDLLEDDDCRSLISWSNKERKEFQLKNPAEIAKRWGAVKRRPGMNHEKMTRSLRFYYTQGIIQKVKGQKLVYKFHKLPYKYHPRKKPCHQQKICEKIKEKLKENVESLTSKQLGQVNNSCSALNSSSMSGRRWDWSIEPTWSSHFTWWYPVIPNCHSSTRTTQTRIMFPSGGQSQTRVPSSLDFEPIPIKTVCPVYSRCGLAAPKSIPVSVIKQTA